jgi:hypothetical protein
VQAGAVTSHHDQAGEDGNEQTINSSAGGQYGTDRRHPMQHGAATPDGAAQESDTLHDQRVLQVSQNDIVAVLRDALVESERARLTAKRVSKASNGALPPGTQRRRRDLPAGKVS